MFLGTGLPHLPISVCYTANTLISPPLSLTSTPRLWVATKLTSVQQMAASASAIFRSCPLVFVLLILIYLSEAQEDVTDSELNIFTTYQAEDAGIDAVGLSQCKAWKIWWKLQVREVK